MLKIDYCKGCKAPIVWVRTEAGKNMPCEPKKVTFITTDGKTLWGYETHWGNCPKRKRFRGSKQDAASQKGEA